MNCENGAVTPPNLVQGRFVHFSADNIDINDSTLDGKNTFHATQVTAWQRGPPPDDLLKNITPSKLTSLNIPEAMESIIPANIIEGAATPLFQDLKKEWFEKSNDIPMSAI